MAHPSVAWVVTAFGPRASIKRIGVCEQLPDGSWFLRGWALDWRNDPRVIQGGCPFMHNEAHEHIGYLGWRWEDLHAVSAAAVALSMVDCTDPPP